MTQYEERRTRSEEIRTRRSACVPYCVLRTLYSVFVLNALFILCVISSPVLGAATPASDVAAAPEVWLVSTRDVPHCDDPGAAPAGLCYWRLDDDCQWSPAEAADFLATDAAATPTVVFIHGNRTDADEAIVKGWYAYEVIRAESGCRPFRYVIWSWPAERVCRRTRPDTQLKVDYSDVESYYLAQWLDQLQPGVKVSLIGHSFGPRIITGALHLLAGGEVAGRSLPPGTVAAWAGGKRNPVRAVLLASALDADWLAPSGCHGRALLLAEQMLVTCNGCDRVLRWYPRLYGRGGPEALGFVGPCGIDDAENVEVVDVACTVGKIHDWRNYCSAANLGDRWAHYMFLDDSPPPP